MYSMVEGASALRMFEESLSLKKKGFKFDFLFMLGLRDFLNFRSDKQKWFSKIEKYTHSSEVFIFPRFPHNTGFFLKIIFIFFNSLICLLSFIKVGGKKKYTILHAHLDIFGFYSVIIKKFSGIVNFYDCHGFRYEEFVLSKGDKHSKWLYSFEHSLEKYTLKNSDEVIAVSSNMVNYIEELTSVKSSLVPMGINEKNINSNLELSDLVRERFDFTNSKTLVYCGNFSRYQCFEYMKSLFSGLNKFSSNYQFILLVPKKYADDVRYFFSDCPNLPTKVFSVSHENVKHILSACDLGVMLREDSIVNRLASPTKFSEYLAAGIPVISTHFVGDYSQFMIKNQAGLILDLYKFNTYSYFRDVDEKITNLIRHSRQAPEKARLRNLAYKNNSWDECTRNLIFLYDKYSKLGS
ncbi:MAG: hypothetical protein CL678_14750 [Bdellovibrionaceae bacterium]|nr:hypothetical protein [Pseudobdellovibrionaceae bacterium]